WARRLLRAENRYRGMIGPDIGVLKMDWKSLEVWFVTGSQHLYGEAALGQVAENSRRVVEGLNSSGRLPVRVVFKQVVTTQESILEVCREANAAADCVGLVCWMHTFSPAK